MKKITLTFLILFLLPLLALSQEEDYSNYSGYVDLNALAGFKKSDTSVEIYLKKPILALVAALSSEEDPTLEKLLGNLALIRVEQFAIDETETKKVDQLIEDVSKKLIKDKWDKLIRAREKDERVEIFLKSENSTISGLLIMAVEGNKEASFINIVGEIDLQLLGKLGAKFNIPSLDDIAQNDNNRKETEK